MVKNKRFWFLAGVGMTGFSICMLLGLICFYRLCMRLTDGMGKPDIQDFFSLALSMSAGFGILMVCVCGIMQLRHIELYQENRLAHAIMDSGCSLILEYCDRTKEQRWLGDAKHIFKAKEGKLTLEQMVHPEDLPLLNQQMADVKRGKVYSAYVRLKDAQDKYRICSFQMIPVREVMGKPERILGIAQDVDADRKRMRKLVEERNQLRNYLLERKKCAIFPCFSTEKAINL